MTVDPCRDRSCDKQGNEWAALCVSEAIHAHWGVRVDLWFDAGPPPAFASIGSVAAYRQAFQPWFQQLRLYQERIFENGRYPYRHFAIAIFDPAEGFKWSLLVFGASGAEPYRFRSGAYGRPDLDWRLGNSRVLPLDLPTIVDFCDSLEVSDVTGRLAGPFAWVDHSTRPVFGADEFVLHGARLAEAGELLDSAAVTFDGITWCDGSARVFELVGGEPLDMMCASFVRSWRWRPGADLDPEGWPPSTPIVEAYRQRLRERKAFRYFDEVPELERRR